MRGRSNLLTLVGIISAGTVLFLVGIFFGWQFVLINQGLREGQGIPSRDQTNDTLIHSAPATKGDLGADLYNEENWELVRYAKFDSLIERNGENDPQKEPVEIYVLRSHERTGLSGVGIPLYDMDVLVVKDEKIAYRFASSAPDIYPRENEISFSGYLADGDIDVRAITRSHGLSVTRDILFESNGFQGASGGPSYLHILRYDDRDQRFEDVSIPEFQRGPFQSYRYVWGMYKGQVRTHVLIADTDKSFEKECHFCPSRYVYTLYAWDADLHKFVVIKTFLSKNLYSDSGDASAYFMEAAGMLGNTYIFLE